MFTGIIEEIGTVRSITRGAHSAVLTVAARKVLEGTEVGDSIAVSGICLTVTALKADGFTADVMHETLNRSSLAGLGAGSRVNLERALPACGRFGGHVVSGHVDGVGRIVRIERDDTAVWYTIQAEPQVLRYVVEKGSVAIDGISLTVAKVTASDFSVSVIPHTAASTTLKDRLRGDMVNIETDIIGKYVEKLLAGGAELPSGAGLPGGARLPLEAARQSGTAMSGAAPRPGETTAKPGGLTKEFLQKYGF